MARALEGMCSGRVVSGPVPVGVVLLFGAVEKGGER